MMIALNNFPFVSLLSKDVSIVSKGFEWQYLLAMLSVAFTEEIVFRGFLVVFLTKFLLEKPIKRRAFKMILITSAIFALTHLINLFSGNVGATILQVLYTFLIAVILTLLAIKSKTIVLPTIAHFVYNIGGNLLQYGLLNGVQWTIGQIVITVVVSLIVAVYVISELYKLSDDELTDFLPELYKS